MPTGFVIATVTNTSPETRTWPDLRRSDGRTLELAPGASADEVEVPEGFRDAYLKVTNAVPVAAEAKTPAPKTAAPKGATPPPAEAATPAEPKE